MRDRLRRALDWTGAVTRSVATGVRRVFWRERNELVLAVGVGLITVALWPVIGRLALLVPGLVCVWTALPPRGSFLVSTDPVPPRRRSVSRDPSGDSMYADTEER